MFASQTLDQQSFLFFAFVALLVVVVVVVFFVFNLYQKLPQSAATQVQYLIVTLIEFLFVLLFRFYFSCCYLYIDNVFTSQQ